MIKILNLYCGIGGNRKFWPKAINGQEIQITAVELSSEIAEVYRKLYPEDEVIIGDAIEYIENNYSKFNFIWASPPCQSHGQYRHNVGVLGKGFSPIMPDMSLYAILVFLRTYFKGEWCVENVIPYYKPLIEPTVKMQRHLFWASKDIKAKEFSADAIRTKNKLLDFEVYEVVAASQIKNKRQVLRNCVAPEVGKYIFDRFFN